MKQRYIIAIAPDSVKLGIAVLDVCEKKMKMHGSLSFADVCKLLQVYKYRPCIVVIEGGWINKSNWHTNECKTFVQAVAIGRNVGDEPSDRNTFLRNGQIVRNGCTNHKAAYQTMERTRWEN